MSLGPRFTAPTDPRTNSFARTCRTAARSGRSRSARRCRRDGTLRALGSSASSRCSPSGSRPPATTAARFSTPAPKPHPASSSRTSTTVTAPGCDRSSPSAQPRCPRSTAHPALRRLDGRRPARPQPRTRTHRTGSRSHAARCDVPGACQGRAACRRVGPEVVPRLLDRPRQINPPAELTPREHEVRALTVEGRFDAACAAWDPTRTDDGRPPSASGDHGAVGGPAVMPLYESERPHHSAGRKGSCPLLPVSSMSWFRSLPRAW